MKRSSVALGLTIALGAVALIVVSVTFLDGGENSRVSPSRSDSSPAPDRAPAPPSDPPADATKDEAPDTASEAPRRGVEFDQSARREGPTLVFVESETGRPRPDADVWMVRRDEVSEEEWEALERFAADAEPLIPEKGHPVELDALAVATLEWSESEALVIATAGERQLRRSIALDTSERRILRLVRREALTVLAVDPGGRRQPDVPVSLQSLRRGEPWQPPPRVVFTKVTNRDGEAATAQGSTLLDQHLDADGLATERVVVAALAFPCRDPSATLVDPRLGCSRPVELVTPPRSKLKLRAVDPVGRSLSSDVLVRVETVDAAPSVLPAQRVWMTKIPSGLAAELTVEADVPIHLVAWTEDGMFALPGTTLLAPAVATTEEVVLELQRNAVPTKPGWMNGRVRVLAPDGSPLRLAELAWQVDTGDMPRKERLQRGRTDADAVLRLEIERSAATGAPASKPQEPVRRGLDVFDGLESPLSGGARRRGAVVWEEPAAPASVDLGTLQLSEIPLLVGGRVLDVAGVGIPDVDVEVTDQRYPPATWTTSTRADGCFSILDTTGARRLDLWPSREGWYRIDEYFDFGIRRPIEVATGRSDLEITLHRKGFVRGRILVDAGISRADLSLGVLPEPAPDVRSRLDPDGRFRVEGAPARRTLLIHSELGGGEPMVEINHVLFEEGKETVDPRLDPIDLRGDLRQIELWVKSAEGDVPIADASVFLTRSRGVLVAPRRTDPFGRAIATTPTLDSALAVGSPAHLFEVFGFDRAFREVKLARAIVVRVKVEGPVGPYLASGNLFPSVELVHASGGGILAELWHRFPVTERRIDDRSFEFLATVTGKYWVSWVLKIPGERWPTVRRPTSVAVGTDRDVVELLEKFTEDEAKAVDRLAAR